MSAVARTTGTHLPQPVNPLQHAAPGEVWVADLFAERHFCHVFSGHWPHHDVRRQALGSTNSFHTAGPVQNRGPTPGSSLPICCCAASVVAAAAAAAAAAAVVTSYTGEYVLQA